MSEVSNVRRHTFNHLDGLLSSEKVASLDSFFLELDVATYMVEGQVSHALARGGYHTLRAVAITVQAIAKAIFTLVKYTALALYHVAKFGFDATVALFVTLPVGAYKLLFPGAINHHEKRVDAAKTAVRDGTFSMAHVVGTDQNRYYCGEQKALLRSLLMQPLNEQKECKPEWKECCNLMEQIADGDGSDDEIRVKEARVKAILNQEREQMPIWNVYTMCETFMDAFRNEREFENELTTEQIVQDPTLLDKYPRLLVRQDVEPIISTVPQKLQKHLSHKKAAVMQRIMKQRHQTELNSIDALPDQLRSIDLDKVREEYTSPQELQFIVNRQTLVNQRLQDLKAAKKEAGFDYYFLRFEQSYLSKQEKKMAETAGSVDFLEGSKAKVKEINQVHEQCYLQLIEALKSRIQKALKSECVTNCQQDQKIAERKASIEAAMGKIDNLAYPNQVEELRKQLVTLHAIELRTLKMGQGSDADLRRIEESIIGNESMNARLGLAHQVQEWTAFSGLTTPKEREESRLNDLSKDVLCMLLETKSECQIPLLLAKQDARYRFDYLDIEDATASRKGVYKSIEQASKEFVEDMQTKYLEAVKKRLPSITEFVSQVQNGQDFEVIETNRKLKKAEKKETLNFKAIGSTLQTADHLSTWYAKLQDIWIDHMPKDQEKMLRTINDSKQRHAKMAECFEQWFERITGKKLEVRLSFDRLSVPDNDEKRAEAFKVLNEHSLEFQAFMQKTKEKMEAAKAKQAQPTIQGFAPDLIMKNQADSPLTDISMVQNFKGEIADVSTEFEDIIAGLERLRASIQMQPGKFVESKTQWIGALDQYIKDTNCTALRPYLLAQCKELIQYCCVDKQEVPPRVRSVFLDNFTVDFEKVKNFERSNFITYFLMIFFAEGKPVTLDEEQYARFRQLCILAALPGPLVQRFMPLVTVGSSPNNQFSTMLTQISQKLQTSSVGLEGLDAEIVRQSFKESGTPINTQHRTLLDSLMSRGTDALSFHLLNHVYTQHGKNPDHHLGREAIARALVHAHSRYPAETKEYVLKKIKENENDKSINPKNFLAPSLYFFYCDILRQIDSDEYFASQQILDDERKFNADLLKVADANYLLMGMSRTITDLCRTIDHKMLKKEPYDEQIRELLFYKIAFQNIKKAHFEGKVEIRDFLKVNVDLAESYMVIVNAQSQAYLMEKANENVMKDTFKKWMNAGTELHQQCVTRELGSIRGQPIFSPTKVEGFFTLSTGVVIDTLTGIIYNDGQQKIQLPPHLQNHPLTRSLGIHNFPYIWDTRIQGFVYYVRSADGKSFPYLIIRDVDKKPVISKRMPTSFSDDTQGYLQFVAKEDIRLPISVMHRMNIQQFWQDQDIIFGYDNEGKLVATFDGATLQTADGAYTILSEDKKADALQIPVLELLSKNFDLNEVLVDDTLSNFFIPALGLKIGKQVDRTGNETWVCHFETLGEKILLSPPEGSAVITMKNKVDPVKLHEVKRAIKEASYRTDLHHADHPTLQDKHAHKQLEANVAKQKARLSAMKNSQFMTTCFDEAYQTEDGDRIIELLPKNLRKALRERLDEENILYAYEIYPRALQMLREEIDDINLNGRSQKGITPLLTAYLEIQKRYIAVCDRAKEAVFFGKASDGTAQTVDLTSALTLAVNQLESEEPDFTFLMKELAKYPLQGPLTPSQLALLERATEQCARNDERDVGFHAYLQFMEYQHRLYKVKELAITPLSDKLNLLQETEQAYAKALQTCHAAIETLESVYDYENPVPKALATIWRKTGIQVDHELLKEDAPTRSKIEKPVNWQVATDFQVLRSKNLLQRLGMQESVVGVPKSMNDLSEHQKELSTTFNAKSREQVSGFYFEKMGYFSLSEFYSDFRLNDKGNGLYGLNQANVSDIFEFLKEEKLITRPDGANSYYRLTSANCCEEKFPANKLRARIATLPISSQDLPRVLERVQTFLYRSMQSGFDFSFKANSEKEFDRKLAQEKQVHLQRYLEAEDILKAELPKFKASMVDLKYAYLTGDYDKFLAPTQDNHKEISRLTNALTRYFFHKSEVQHIENVQKAPSKGERNKIQLLQTKRNYSVDFLLQEDLQGAQRKEQIMQRAYLAFEEDYGNRCNMLQIRMFRALMLGQTSIEGIDAIQARMGFGKTALLPMLAIVRIAMERTLKSQERHLVRYVVPRAVLEDNTSSFNQRLSSILGSTVAQDKDFSRYQIDKDNPKTSFQLAIIDLKSRLHFYEELRKDGHMVIQPPEVRCSMEAQDLDFAEMLRTQCFDEETLELCLEAKRLLVQIRTIPTYNVFDELDDTQDFKSREVNFTRGDKVAIPTENIRPLERLVSYIEANKNNVDWTVKSERVKEMVMALCTDRNGNKITQCPQGLVDYLSKQSVAMNVETEAFLSAQFVNNVKNDPEAKQTENDALFFLIRMVMLDDYILSLIRSKQPAVHYGIRFSIEPGTGNRLYSLDPTTNSALLISVPYEGVDTPKGLSVFDNREVAALTTLRYYYSNEVNLSIHPHLNFLINQIREDTIPADLIAHYLPGKGTYEHPAVDALRKMAKMLDMTELKKAKEEFFENYMRAPTTEFRKFFGMAVVATQIRSDEGCAKSDRYEEGSTGNINLGCSGTVGDTSSYFTKQAPDPAADGMLSLDIMGRDNNSEIEWLAPDYSNGYLSGIINALLDCAKPNTNGIADIAGLCKSRDGTPETVIKELWTQLKARKEFAHFQGIKYYGKDNVKRLFVDGKEPIVLTTEMELARIRSGIKDFSFYKQKNCRGSDMKQPDGTHFEITMDENVSNSDAKQTALRYRPIVTPDSGQSFSFVALPEYKEIVRDALKGEKQEALNKVNGEISALSDMIEKTEEKIKKDRKNVALHKELRSLKTQTKPLEVRAKTLEADIRLIEGLDLKAKHIAYYLRQQEKNAEQENALTLFKKELKAHIKVASGHLEADIMSQLPAQLNKQQNDAYREFLQARNKLSPFIERSLNSLYQKYGMTTSDMARDPFIQEELRKVNEALNELFGAAEDFAQKVGAHVRTQKNTYIKRINKSKKAFETRYAKDKPVQVPGTRNDGQNVAQAQAQAQAQAEAEAVTETITQSLLETQERIWTPKLNMSKTPKQKVNFDFLTDAALLDSITNPANGVKGVPNSIKPAFRDLCFTSPLLNKKAEVAHFVLLDDQTDRFIFISQEEAEGFKAEKERLHKANQLNGSPFGQYTLMDMRTPANSVDIAQLRAAIPVNVATEQLPCVALGDNKIPQDFRKLKTNDLRTCELTNVTSDQLIPHLELVHSDPATKGFVKPTQFGIAQEKTFKIDINSPTVKGKLNINVDTVKSSILTDNKHLSNYMKAVYGDPTVTGKVKEVHTRLDAEYKRLFPKIKELEEKKKQLEKLITSVDSFDLKYDMKAGLQLRDRDNPQFPGWSDIGKDAIKFCEDITKLQQELKTNPKVDTLKQLKAKFNEFAAPSMLKKAQEFGFDYKKELLFDDKEWDKKLKVLSSETTYNKKFDQVSVLERVYGRIVHSVHGHDVESARTCSRQDCCNMFTNFIPDLLNVIPKLQTALDDCDKIEKQIADLLKDAKPWMDAVECAAQLVKDEQKIEEALANKGLHHAKGTFFDQFDFENLANAPIQDFSITFKMTLPTYRDTVVKDMHDYKNAFRGLTEAETQVFEQNRNFLDHVLSQSATVEKRDSEVTLS